MWSEFRNPPPPPPPPQKREAVKRWPSVDAPNLWDEHKEIEKLKTSVDNVLALSVCVPAHGHFEWTLMDCVVSPNYQLPTRNKMLLGTVFCISQIKVENHICPYGKMIVIENCGKMWAEVAFDLRGLDRDTEMLWNLMSENGEENVTKNIPG